LNSDSKREIRSVRVEEDEWSKKKCKMRGIIIRLGEQFR